MTRRKDTEQSIDKEHIASYLQTRVYYSHNLHEGNWSENGLPLGTLTLTLFFSSPSNGLVDIFCFSAGRSRSHLQRHVVLKSSQQVN